MTLSMNAVVVDRHGGPEVLRWTERERRAPEAHEVELRLDAVGVNFVDAQHRAGAPYPVAPGFVPGIEGAGTVVRVGERVSAVRPGDRVGAAGPMCGWYAQYAVVPEDVLVALPDALDGVLAAAALLQGMTAHMLSETVAPLDAGQVAVVHAAAGGVGLMLTQYLAARGVTVVGTASSDAKAEVARRFGAAHVTPPDQLLPAVDDVTRGAGADAVFDGVGGALFVPSLRALRGGGHMVSFGQSGGRAAPIDPAVLGGLVGEGVRGALSLTWPTLSHHNARPEDLRRRAADVFARLADGRLRVHLHGVRPLHEAAEAHRALEARATVGKLVLRP